MIERYSYDAYGNPYEGRFLNMQKNNPFGFTGQSFEPELRMYSFAYRTYSPMSMRWMTVDPARDGTNWYQYVSGDPVNLWDPLGLKITIQGTDYYMAMVEEDIQELKNMGNSEVKKMVEEIEASEHEHIIRFPTRFDDGYFKDGNYPEDLEKDRNGIPTGSITEYNQTRYNKYQVDSKVILIHELNHAYNTDKGTTDYTNYNGIPKYEIDAVNMENKVRLVTGDIPIRTKYGDNEIPQSLIEDPYKREDKGEGKNEG